MKRLFRSAAVLSAATLLTMPTLVAPAAALAQPTYPGAPLFTTLADALSQVPTPQTSYPVPLGPATPLATEAGLTGLQLTTGFLPAGGQIYHEYGHYGAHAVQSTGVITSCGPFYQLYNEVLRLGHGVTTDISCYGTYPAGDTSWVGSELIYPADSTSATPAPLLIMSPGIGVEPGMMQAHAEFFASHGYVVALGYSMANWFGNQMLLAAAHAATAATDPSHPLHQAIDFTASVAVGHSAGGGSALRVAELLPQAMQSLGVADFQLQGTVGINPGPSDFGLASPPVQIPLLVLVAEHESLVAHPLSRLAYDRATGPKWWAVHAGAYHGTYLDTPLKNSYDATVLAFLRFCAGDPAASQVFTGANYQLASDSEWIAVERG